ncbi:hypothetical protein EZJ49_08580 [Bdellovibrio bacteriovorus]|uniref:hypothetical protein n=1 Tax=Bdellovibrio bacteriovorus TaxID=959 RepID=UPI0021CF7415|nr:hypothetical protein [Bdellovibrio bacteriovorus]UXR63130.1 hypothetical protein EZJ49_08580 [Bdellovibrio bacteriovorus]
MSPKTPFAAQSFKKYAEELCAFIEQEGWAVRPYHSESLPFFLQLNESERESTTELLRQYLEVCQRVYSKGRRLKDMPFLVETALEYYGYQVFPQTLAKLRQNQSKMVEFYSRKHTQFFRSLNFFEFTSYTIEDLYCRQWVHLYDREESMTMRILSEANKVLAGDLSEPIFVPEAHILKERLSLERLQVQMQNLQLEPLFKNGQSDGIMAVADCTWAL